MSTLPALTHLTLPQCYLFQIPALQSQTQGYKAADWPKQHIFQGALTLQSQNSAVTLRFTHNNDELFLELPINDSLRDVEPASDSSRYFVLRLPASSKVKVLGLGFQTREVAFDFKSTLQDVMNARQRGNLAEMSSVTSSSSSSSQPLNTSTDDTQTSFPLSSESSINRSLASGQKIHINMPSKAFNDGASSNSQPQQRVSPTKANGSSKAFTDILSSIQAPPAATASKHRSNATHTSNVQSAASSKPISIDAFDPFAAPTSNATTTLDDPFAELNATPAEQYASKFTRAATAKDDWVAF